MRDAVLVEFSHRCSVCGADRPQLHHIDENPSNNEPLNLLPLCPNCHLNDRHNPTAPVDKPKLRLFREFKDPAILRSQFQPLFTRLRFLDVVADTDEVKVLEGKATELVEFVASLEMGTFYSGRIGTLLKRPARGYVVSLSGPDPEHERLVRKHHQEYREQLRSARNEVYRLAVELLRYQRWGEPSPARGRDI